MFMQSSSCALLVKWEHQILDVQQGLVPSFRSADPRGVSRTEVNEWGCWDLTTAPCCQWQDENWCFAAQGLLLAMAFNDLPWFSFLPCGFPWSSMDFPCLVLLGSTEQGGNSSTGTGSLGFALHNLCLCYIWQHNRFPHAREELSEIFAP